MGAHFQSAEPADAEALFTLVQEFYAAARYPFDALAARRALAQLLADPGLGGAWLAVEAGKPVGYAVVCYGFSVEYGGRDAFVDELFVRPSHRGAGLGAAALELVERHCREQGIRALHLEVERANEAARALYRARGFAGNERRLLTKRLAPGARGAEARRRQR